MGLLVLIPSVNGATVNLTAVGSTDWAVWNANGVVAPSSTKSGGGSTIAVATADAVGSYTNDPRTITWSNGTPNGSGSETGGNFDSATGGLTFTFPASTVAQTAYLYLGGFNATTTSLVASLSDGSAATQTYTGFTAGATSLDYVVAIQYQANSGSQTLSVVWKFLTGSGNVTWQAAALGPGTGGGVIEEARPYTLGRLGLGRTFKRLRSAYADTVSSTTVGVLAASAASASSASFSLQGSPGTLAFSGASSSAASFALSAGIALSGASASTAVVPASGGIGISGASASSATVAPTAGAGFSGSSASSTTFSLSGSPGAMAFDGSSASAATVSVLAQSTGPSFTGASASSATFGLSAQIAFSGSSASAAQLPLQAAMGLNGASASAAAFPLAGGIAFTGASASAAQFGLTAAVGIAGSSGSSATFDLSGSTGALNFAGSSASSAIVNASALSSGSIFFNGASASAAQFTLGFTYTPPSTTTGSNAPTLGGGGGDKDGHRYLKPWSGKLEFKGDIDKEIAAEWARIRYGDPEEPAPTIRPVEMPKRPLLTRKGVVAEPEKPRDEEDDEVALLMIDAHERGLAMMALSLLRRLK